MPNWCYNKLEVYSENIQSLQNFIDLVKDSDSDLSLNNLLPCPQELLLTICPNLKPDPKIVKKYCCGDWYQWRIKNWGIHRDVKAQADRVSDSIVLYTFASPWNPPFEWIKYSATQFPDLEFTLYYDGSEMGYEGFLMVHGYMSIDEWHELTTL